jgi:predicted Zn-dependent protease
MPDWLSTHPSPGNRTSRIQAQIAATGTSGAIVNRSEYLRQLDGMVFGEDPREGFFQEDTFYHPALRFQLAFPRGFDKQNQKQAVVGVSEGKDAILALTLAAGTSPEEAARRFSSQQGIQAGRSGRETIGGLPAHTVFFEAATGQGALRGQVSFVSYEGKIYRILGYTPAERFARYEGAFAATLHSFRRVTDSRYLEVKPQRIALVNLEREMALSEFARTYPSTVRLETLGLINGLAPSGTFPRGGLAKRVVGGRLPD